MRKKSRSIKLTLINWNMAMLSLGFVAYKIAVSISFQSLSPTDQNAIIISSIAFIICFLFAFIESLYGSLEAKATWDRIQKTIETIKMDIEMAEKANKALTKTGIKNPDAAADSIHFRMYQMVKMLSARDDIPANAIRHEINSEYDGLFIVKRKSTPLDDILRKFDADKFL